MMEIRQIQPDQIKQAKQVIVDVCLEVWQGDITEDDLKQHDPLLDVERVESHYLLNRGIFFVLLDARNVVGTGGIRALEDDICELKRMWFLKAYRGLGWGQTMLEMLLDFAKEMGFKRVRLDLLDREQQRRALNLYQKFGFYPIVRYNDSPCTVFLEKKL